MKGNFLTGTKYSTTHFHAYLCLPTPTVIPNISEASAHSFTVSDSYPPPSELSSLCLEDSGPLSVCRLSSKTTSNSNQLSERPFPATLIRQTTAVVTSEMSACPIYDTSFRYWQKSFGGWSSAFRKNKSLQHSKIKHLDSQNPHCKTHYVLLQN